MADFGEAVFNRIPEKSEVKMVSGSRASRSSASVPESDLAVLEKEIECLVREKNLIDKIANERGYIVEIQKKLISDLEDKFRSQPVGNSSKNKDCVSYSAIVKKMDHSYLLIKPADRSTSYKTVENDFKSRYSPGALNVNINKTKLTKNGLMISCNSKKDVEILKDSLKSDLGNKFDVCEPTKMFPRMLIQGVPNDCFKNPGPDKLEFVDSFVDDLIFNNNLGVNSDDIKIISCYKMGDVQVAVTVLCAIALVVLVFLAFFHKVNLLSWIQAWIRANKEEKVSLTRLKGHYNANGYLNSYRKMHSKIR
ncbi:unnamed protein product [Acanthoscelides obtectus]|uniref:Uncharacterized protein n=1 Tax=Acanthoscelides obtectus TaxID=200917 RepID=A0A9P0MFG5_ACAOB|nr:unnamed protein product [Acanthoscelides obtectus]CAK1631202.1 hypothetical protein AOBTE_LOCUS6811 [Acanthoscelides obtectus]